MHPSDTVREVLETKDLLERRPQCPLRLPGSLHSNQRKAPPATPWVSVSGQEAEEQLGLGLMHWMSFPVLKFSSADLEPQEQGKQVGGIPIIRGWVYTSTIHFLSKIICVGKTNCVTSLLEYLEGHRRLNFSFQSPPPLSSTCSHLFQS